jgi:hypothetical protein
MPHHPTPHPQGLPRYGGGEMEKKDTDSNHLMRTTIAEDPFSDDINDLLIHQMGLFFTIG